MRIALKPESGRRFMKIKISAMPAFSEEELSSMHSHAANALAIKQGLKKKSTRRKYWVHSPDNAPRDVLGGEKLNYIAKMFYEWIGNRGSHRMSTMTGSLIVCLQLL